MTALRIIAGIVGLWFVWLYTISNHIPAPSYWSQMRRTSLITIIFVAAFALLQFSMAGHL